MSGGSVAAKLFRGALAARARVCLEMQPTPHRSPAHPPEKGRATRCGLRELPSPGPVIGCIHWERRSAAMRLTRGLRATALGCAAATSLLGCADDAAPLPSVTLTSDATTVALGQRVTLTWTTRNASGCSAEGAWSGSKAANGSVVGGGAVDPGTEQLRPGLHQGHQDCARRDRGHDPAAALLRAGLAARASRST